MTKTNIVILIGVGLLAYWYFKKYKQNEPVDVPPIADETKPEEPKTIVINLNNKREKVTGVFPYSMYQRYDASKTQTVAPPSTKIFNSF